MTKCGICETGREIVFTDTTIDKNVIDKDSRVYGMHIQYGRIRNISQKISKLVVGFNN